MRAVSLRRRSLSNRALHSGRRVVAGVLGTDESSVPVMQTLRIGHARNTL